MGFFENIIFSIAGIALDLITKLCEASIEIATTPITEIITKFTAFETIYGVMAQIGLALLVVFVLISAVNAFAAPLGAESEPMIPLLFKAVVVGALLFVSKDIVMALIEPIGYVIETINNKLPFGNENIFDALKNVATVALGSEEYYAALADGNYDAINNSGNFGLAGILLSVSLIWVIGLNVLKLAFEIAERYLVIVFLVFTAPMAASTAASSKTKNIFSKWISMLFAQSLLLVISVVSIRVFLYAFNSGASELIKAQGNGSDSLLPVTIVFVLLMTGFLKVAQRADEIMNTLGISAVKTGGNMTAELLGAASTVAGMVKSTAKTVTNGNFVPQTDPLSGKEKIGSISTMARDSVVKRRVDGKMNSVMGTQINRAQEGINKTINSEKFVGTSSNPTTPEEKRKMLQNSVSKEKRTAQTAIDNAYKAATGQNPNSAVFDSKKAVDSQFRDNITKPRITSIPVGKERNIEKEE